MPDRTITPALKLLKARKRAAMPQVPFAPDQADQAMGVLEMLISGTELDPEEVMECGEDHAVATLYGVQASPITAAKTAFLDGVVVGVLTVLIELGEVQPE